MSGFLPGILPAPRQTGCWLARRASLFVLLLLLAACGEKEEFRLTPVSFKDLSGWAQDDHMAALATFRNSCDAVLKKREYALRIVCMNAFSATDAKTFFEENFQPYAVNKGNPGLFTGYFEPEYKGALQQGGAYQYPLYAMPDNIVTADLGLFLPALAGQRIVGRVAGGQFVPYHTRQEIEAGALTDKGRPLVWLKDPNDVFFLHIQGSGKIGLPDGRFLRVSYAGKNGRAYHSIGRYLVETGALTLEEASMESIRTWLDHHPNKADAVRAQNASYIFFRTHNARGALGALNIPLVAGRSLAVDPEFIALGTPVFLVTNAPPLHRLMIAQDTGGAIKGPVRGDVFWGTGNTAGEAAGTMRAQGTYYILLPRGEDHDR